MELIKKYINEVTRRLAENMREDIRLELESTILDMLPEDFTNEEVYEVLNELGDPTVMAAGFRDRPMHLIGPKFYDIYLSLLKLIIPIVGIIVFIITLFDNIYTISESEAIGVTILLLFGKTLGILTTTVMQTFFWITLVFIILERTIEPSINVPLNLSGKKWTASDLDKVNYVPAKKEINKFEPIFLLFWTAIWVTVYFNAENIIGIYEKVGDSGLAFISPVFNQDTLHAYLVIIMIYIAFEIIRSLYMLIVHKWTMTLVSISFIVHFLSLTILINLALHPNLLDPAFVPYMAELIGSSVENVDLAIFWIKTTIIIGFIAAAITELYKGYKKAKLK